MYKTLDRYHRVAVYGSGVCKRRLEEQLITSGKEVVNIQNFNTKAHPEVDAVIIAEKDRVDLISDILHRNFFVPVLSAEEVLCHGMSEGKKNRKKPNQKAAILTFFAVGENYGQTLQAFAVQDILRKLYVDSYIVNFSYRAVSKGRIKDFIRPGMAKRIRFHRFIGKRIKRTKFCVSKTEVVSEIRRLGCDAIICGSDQIWNYANHRFDGDMYFANFPGLWEINKISFAASIGIGNIEDANERRLFRHEADMIARFDNISVREHSSVGILQEFLPGFDKKIHCIVDPCFLVSVREWRSVSRRMRAPKHYILCYFVGEMAGKDKRLECWAQEKGLPVLYIGTPPDHKNLGSKVLCPGPEEFLWLIDHADYVFGDSFHMVVFSLIFRKQFYLMHRVEHRVEGYDRDARIENIEKIFGFGCRFVDNGNFSALPPVSYDGFEEILKAEQMKAVHFLKHALRLKLQRRV